VKITSSHDKDDSMETTTHPRTDTERCRIRRHPERSAPTEAQKFLSQGNVAHVGFLADGQPYVIPFSYQYDPEAPDKLYLHGSPASRALNEMANGTPVCVTVTLVDALVYSRSALYHSMNYRCVTCFGHGRLLKSPDEKRAIFEAMTERYLPGRTAGKDYETASLEQLNSTMVIEVQIAEMSAKTRTGGPLGPRDANPEEWGSAGVLALDSGERPINGNGAKCPFSSGNS
jgi:nitroimidazol reductase NimA-like FMN-containing flavoprotein (pyridoxamine 5'-phosphate oxidase superfamily)